MPAIVACLGCTPDAGAQFGGGLKLPGTGGGKSATGVDAAAIVKEYGFNVPMTGGNASKLVALLNFESKASDATVEALKDALAAALKAQGSTMELKGIDGLSKGVDTLCAASEGDLKNLSAVDKKNRDEALAKLWPALLVGGKMVGAVPATIQAASDLKSNPSVEDMKEIGNIKAALEAANKTSKNMTKIAPCLPKLVATLNNAGIKKPDSKEITLQANTMLKASGAGGEISSD
jgi:hypothetical protein